MRYAKILRINEFNQLQDIVNHCHLYVVESSGIRLNANREKIYESGSATQPESSILVIPNTIADTTENVQKITKTIVDYLGEGAVGGSTAFSLGKYFTGDYASADCLWDETCLCVGLPKTIGEMADILALAAELMNKLHIGNMLATTPNQVTEITKDNVKQKRESPHGVKRIMEH